MIASTLVHVPKRSSHPNNESDLKKRFGATVRTYRQRLAISQEELAWRAEMHRTYLADVERGARNLSLSSMARLVSGIGVSLSEFFAMLESLGAPAPAAGRANGANARRKRRVSGRDRRRKG